MFVKRIGGGRYYIHKGKPSKKKLGKNWFLVKYGYYGLGVIHSNGKIHLPKEVIGKKVRFRMEVVE